MDEVVWRVKVRLGFQEWAVAGAMSCWAEGEYGGSCLHVDRKSEI